MKRFAPIFGEYSHFHNDYVFKSLKDATNYIDYRWVGRRHRALADALACRALWQWMENRDDFNGAPQRPNPQRRPGAAPIRLVQT